MQPLYIVEAVCPELTTCTYRLADLREEIAQAEDVRAILKVEFDEKGAHETTSDITEDVARMWMTWNLVGQNDYGYWCPDDDLVVPGWVEDAIGDEFAIEVDRYDEKMLSERV